jgi:hypothetical protein
MTTNYTIPAGLTLRAGGDSVSCDDCGVWEYLGRGIRHSRRCGCRTLQATPEAVTPVAPKSSRSEILSAARDGSLSAVASEYEVDQMLACGAISVSAAMNRDF